MALGVIVAGCRVGLSGALFYSSRKDMTSPSDDHPEKDSTESKDIPETE